MDCKILALLTPEGFDERFWDCAPKQKLIKRLMKWWKMNMRIILVNANIQIIILIEIAGIKELKMQLSCTKVSILKRIIAQILTSFGLNRHNKKHDCTIQKG